ncbi:DUF2927 domain-containing protein [Actinoplanes sp. CA-252034]|uniref:DUF2927 domain-containing protein n=1 Tax=Actinoplanes sp. CA-252034 TaxID=3239906 RepID=UPI003D98E610
MLIRSTGISESMRCHLIREELTQSMGMLQDSRKYRDSIFQADYGRATVRCSAIDKEVIRLLYRGTVFRGQDRKTIRNAVTVR